jgi:glutamyl/glutaminyl-tRNA synthetase
MVILHIGHVKAICLNFGIAEEFDGLCNLRFDDTNPDAEEQEYVDGIANDVKWLGLTGMVNLAMLQVILINFMHGLFN